MKYLPYSGFRTALLVTALLMSMAFSGCNYQDQIDDLKVRVDALESAMQKLQQAYSDGKIITKTEPFNEGEGGYYITFSDGSTIVLNNGAKGEDGADGSDGKDGIDGKPGADGSDGADGADGKDGVTPLVKIDDEGYWVVSYDDGNSYVRLTDSKGNPIYAHGKDGENGADGNDGKPGADGKDGSDGLCVRVDVKDGRYVFVIYDPSDPDTIIESIPTLYAVEPGSVLQSIVRDETSGVITITMADGTEFRFNLDVCYPTSVMLITEAVSMGAGGTAQIEFRVNPSNAYIDYSTTGAMPGVELDVLGTRYGYVTAPEHYKLAYVTPARDEVGRVKQGQYIAGIEDLSTMEAYDDRVAIVLNTHDGRGDVVQITSSGTVAVSCGTGSDIMSLTLWGQKYYPDSNNVFNIRVPEGEQFADVKAFVETNAMKVQQEGKDFMPGSYMQLDLTSPLTLVATSAGGSSSKYRVHATFSNLPTVYVTTPAEITSKDEWVKECTLSISNAGGENIELGKVQMKGRGNSTWLYPKKGYAIKLDKKTELLGMPRHKRWCLLANWMDRTLMRNEIAFEVGRRMQGLDWTPSGKFVELVFNGKHIGNYYLCEQIKVDPNRVQITEMKSTDTDAESITGGYLLELDVNYDEVFKFRTRFRKLPVMVQSPDDDVMVNSQFKYIENYMNRIEAALYPSNRQEFVGDLIDLESFADWFIVNELLVNTEPSWPKSSYMHKDRGGKMKAGPIWDYDYYTMVPAKEQWFIANSLWYNGLFKVPEFVAVLKKRWEMHKASLATIPDYIDAVAGNLKESQGRNIKMWPITSEVNGDEKLGFEDAVSRLKTSYVNRYEWMDRKISEM